MIPVTEQLWFNVWHMKKSTYQWFKLHEQPLRNMVSIIFIIFVFGRVPIWRLLHRFVNSNLAYTHTQLVVSPIAHCLSCSFHTKIYSRVFRIQQIAPIFSFFTPLRHQVPPLTSTLPLKAASFGDHHHQFVCIHSGKLQDSNLKYSFSREWVGLPP